MVSAGLESVGMERLGGAEVFDNQADNLLYVSQWHIISVYLKIYQKCWTDHILWSGVGKDVENNSLRYLLFVILSLHLNVECYWWNIDEVVMKWQ